MSAGTLVLLFLMMLFMSGALAYVVVQNTGSRALMRTRLASIAGVKTGSSAKASAQPARRTKQIKSKLEEAGGAGDKPSRRVELRLLIDRAGMSITAKQFYIASAVSGVLGTFIYLILRYPPLYFPVVLLVMGVGLPRWYLKRKAARRQKMFTSHFADAIDVIVRGIRSGLPVGECLNIIARESPEPVGGQFKLLVESQKMGMTMKQALERACRDMPTADMKFFAIVLNLQQQTGGNLAETLAGLSDVLRARKKMADKVKAMSAEARMTAAIIGSMPFLISGMIYLINPEYISLLWTDHTGKKIFYGGLVWMSMGVLIMKQMIAFEI
jgi:tight adherence protein B